MTTEDVLREEMELLKADIIKAYERSDRRVTGQFAEGLKVVYEPYKATLYGFEYLAGRGRTKKSGKAGEPTVLERIKQWIQDKGIARKALSKAGSLSEKGKKNLVRGIAYVITRKIHEKGTNRENWWKIYEEVITPQRINSIINRVAELNVNRLITEIITQFEILAKNR